MLHILWYNIVENKKGGIKMIVDILGTKYELDINNRETGNAGEFLPANETISLKNYDTNESFMYKTLWHEIIHAIFYLQGDYNYCDDESFVQRTSNAIAYVIENNLITQNSDLFKEGITNEST
jgi:predicted SprT family Zn-dependent metalloprotease